MGRIDTWGAVSNRSTIDALGRTHGDRHGGRVGRWSAVTANLTPAVPGTTGDCELMAAARMMLQRMASTLPT